MATPSLSLRELDVLRGLAAIFMVFNHTGYALLSQETTEIAVVAGTLFLTGFAPTLFFLRHRRWIWANHRQITDNPSIRIGTKSGNPICCRFVALVVA